MGSGDSKSEEPAKEVPAATPAAAAAGASPAAAAPAAAAPAAAAAKPAAAATPEGPEARRMSVLGKQLEAHGCTKESTKRTWMEHFAVDTKGNVLDQDKHDKACAGMAGAVDGAGNVVNEDKFKAASDAIAEEGKAKAKERADAKKAKGAAAKKVETGSKICVRNLHEDVNTEKLTAMFAAFGAVGRVDVKTKEGGKCKGFGFVAFATKDEADKAMKEMNEKMVDGKKLAVTLAFESVEGGKGKGKDDGKDGKGKGKGKDDGKGSKGKGKGKKGDAMTVGGYPQADQYQAYQAQVQQWYAMQMQAAMMAQYQAQQVQGWYSQSMGTDASAAPQAGGAAPAAAAAGKEYTGTLKRITTRNGYGFIECPELKGQWKDDKNTEGRDIYIAAAMIPESCTEPGAKVKFTLALNSKGHPQAASCVAIAG